MRKNIALILAVICVLSSVMAACSTKKVDDGDTTKGAKATSDAGLNASDDEFIMETEEVTDEKGEKVTNKDGEVETTVVYYRKDKDDKNDKDGKDTYIKQDENGNDVTDKDGNKQTTKVTTTSGGIPEVPTSSKPTKPATSTTMAGDDTAPTKSELTTLALKDDVVPSTSATGKKVAFSPEDQQIIKSMLEVPYLYTSSYENKDGVPTNVAAHVAMWMAQREGLNTTQYASGTIVLDLFKYFAQTVVNFKTQCNAGKDEQSSIKYVAKDDSFVITSFESSTHTVKLTKIENLGNNNYYKVYADVSGASGISKVQAVIQKNQIEATLGFSIKALKWS